MYDLVSIGNISLDTFYRGESLTYDAGRFKLAVGGKYFADFAKQALGGGGANVAIGVSKHGLKTAVIGTIGNNPFKRTILLTLEEAGVSTELCVIEDEYLNVSAILLTAKGEKTIVHYSTEHKGILRELERDQSTFKTKMFYLGNLPDVSIYERTRFVEKAKRQTIPVAVNLGVQDCRLPKTALRPLLTHLDILILNGHEFAELVKAQYKDIHFKEDIIGWYIPQLKHKHVIVTEGVRGSYLYFNSKVHHQKSEEILEVTDTTGAGDGFTAGFLSSYLKGDRIEKAMKIASEYAAKIIKKIGAN